MDLLDDPAYFKCEALHGVFKKVHCLKLQQKRVDGGRDEKMRYACCEACEQGQRNRAELGMDTKMDAEKKTKVCAKCKGIKSLDEFHKNSTTEDGYYNQCKECRSKYYKASTAASDQRSKGGGRKSEVRGHTSDIGPPTSDSEVGSQTSDNRPAAFPMSFLLIDVVRKMEQAQQEVGSGTYLDALDEAYEAALELAVRLRLAVCRGR